jgi:hypothetical protein
MSQLLLNQVLPLDLQGSSRPGMINSVPSFLGVLGVMDSTVRPILFGFGPIEAPVKQIYVRAANQGSTASFAARSDGAKATTVPIADDSVVRKLLLDKFEKLADEWESETSLLSSPSSKAAHPAYQAIIQMGSAAVGFILQRMKNRGGHWFWALSALTGAHPIPKKSHGIISEMREAWLTWGRERGYC